MPRMDANFSSRAAPGPHGMCLTHEILDILEAEVARHTYAGKRQSARGQTQAASLSIARLGALADALGIISGLMSVKPTAGAEALAFISAYGPNPPPHE